MTMHFLQNRKSNRRQGISSTALYVLGALCSLVVALNVFLHDRMVSISLSVMGPLASAVSGGVSVVSEAAHALTLSKTDLLKENEALKAQLKAQESEIIIGRLAHADVQSICAAESVSNSKNPSEVATLLQSKNTLRLFATVIGYNTMTFGSLLLQFEKDASHLTATGTDTATYVYAPDASVIGTLQYVKKRYATVTLLSDSQSIVQARIEGGDIYELRGLGSNTMVMSVPTSMTVTVGATVTLPAAHSAVVGTVREVREATDDAQKTVIIAPLTNARSLRTVSLIIE